SQPARSSRRSMGYSVPVASFVSRPISAPDNSCRGDAKNAFSTLSVGPVILGWFTIVESLHRVPDIVKGQARQRHLARHRACDKAVAMATEIPFRRDFAFAYARAERLSPLIRRVVARNASPFTFKGTGTYIIGRGKVAVIDPGPALDDHVAALLEAVSGESVTHILITHTHLDHSPAAAALKRATGAKTYGFGPHGSRRPAESIGGTTEEGGDRDFVPDVALRDGDVAEGPGWRLEAVETPGHTSNHLCFALPEERTLFTGDHVMGWSTSVIAPPDGDMAAYMRSLEKLLAREDALYW